MTRNDSVECQCRPGLGRYAPFSVSHTLQYTRYGVVYVGADGSYQPNAAVPGPGSDKGQPPRRGPLRADPRGEAR